MNTTGMWPCMRSSAAWGWTSFPLMRLQLGETVVWIMSSAIPLWFVCAAVWGIWRLVHGPVLMSGEICNMLCPLTAPSCCMSFSFSTLFPRMAITTTTADCGVVPSFTVLARCVSLIQPWAPALRYRDSPNVLAPLQQLFAMFM